MEDRLGHARFVRNRRRIALTPDAVQYAAEVRAALKQIAQASLKLTVSPSGRARSTQHLADIWHALADAAPG
ncbi:MAG: hypothetical protein Q4P24_15510 [Rhodobacterales bacterium]|nr:hypothetical protein [Rhodobacterales bacterium]